MDRKFFLSVHLSFVDLFSEDLRQRFQQPIRQAKLPFLELVINLRAVEQRLTVLGTVVGGKANAVRKTHRDVSHIVNGRKCHTETVLLRIIDGFG